ncbi:hypothetical protein GCM10009629_43350 [Pseudonocardia alni]
MRKGYLRRPPSHVRPRTAWSGAADGAGRPRNPAPSCSGERPRLPAIVLYVGVPDGRPRTVPGCTGAG